MMRLSCIMKNIVYSSVFCTLPIYTMHDATIRQMRKFMQSIGTTSWAIKQELTKMNRQLNSLQTGRADTVNIQRSFQEILEQQASGFTQLHAQIAALSKQLEQTSRSNLYKSRTPKETGRIKKVPLCSSYVSLSSIESLLSEDSSRSSSPEEPDNPQCTDTIPTFYRLWAELDMRSKKNTTFNGYYKGTQYTVPSSYDRWQNTYTLHFSDGNKVIHANSVYYPTTTKKR